MRLLKLAPALIASLALSAGAVSGATVVTVAGSFTYSPNADSPTRAVSIRAQSDETVLGSWRWVNLTNGVWRTGAITCLVVDGSDAWLAGPETSTNGDPVVGAFFRIHDGGAPGTQVDTAVAFIADPGQTLAELEGWCSDKRTDVSLDFDLDSGNLTIAP